MRTIDIYWDYPRDYDKLSEHPDADKLGIYYITRVWGNKEYVIYVGKTLQAFKDRMYQHEYDEDPYTQLKGRMKIRLGTIPQSFNLGNMNKDHFLLTLESAIIQNIKDKPGARLINKKQLVNCSYYYNIEITNCGFPGIIDRNIIVEKNQ